MIGPVNAFSGLFGQGKYFQVTLSDSVNQVAWDQPGSFDSWAQPISGNQALNLNPNSMPSVPIGPGIYIGNYIWKPEFTGIKITQVGFTMLQDKYPLTVFLTVYTKAFNSLPGDTATPVQLPGAFVPRVPGPPPPADRTMDTFFGYAADPGYYITSMEVLVQATGFESPDAKAYPHLDDLAFVAVPEPATLGLVTALGLLGVAAVRARGRK